MARVAGVPRVPGMSSKLLGVLVKRSLASGGAEVIHLPSVRGRAGSLPLIYIHPTDWINCHYSSPPAFAPRIPQTQIRGHSRAACYHAVTNTTNPRMTVKTPIASLASAFRGMYQWAIPFSVRRLATSISNTSSGTTNITL